MTFPKGALLAQLDESVPCLGATFPCQACQKWGVPGGAQAAPAQPHCHKEPYIPQISGDRMHFVWKGLSYNEFLKDKCPVKAAIFPAEDNEYHSIFSNKE